LEEHLNNTAPLVVWERLNNIKYQELGAYTNIHLFSPYKEARPASQNFIERYTMADVALYGDFMHSLRSRLLVGLS
jgi:hypothetical protein